MYTRERWEYLRAYCVKHFDLLEHRLHIIVCEALPQVLLEYCLKHYWNIACILCEAFATSTTGVLDAYYVKHLLQLLLEYCVHIV